LVREITLKGRRHRFFAALQSKLGQSEEFPQQKKLRGSTRV